MTVLFTPIAQSFTGVSNAASGAVNRWIYTVPALKRAILVYSFLNLPASANAVNTMGARVVCTIGGIIFQPVRIFNQAVLTAEISEWASSVIDLQAGDTVQGTTINNGANNATITIQAVIREYN